MTAPRGWRARVEAVGGAIGAPVGHAGWRERRGVWLALSDAEGNVGQGEACPLSREIFGHGHGHGHGHGESAAGGELEACRAFLEGCVERAELGGDAGAAVGLLRLAGARPAEVPPAGWFAFETAVVDLVGRVQGRSAADVLRAGPPRYDRVERSGLLGADPDRWEEELGALLARGVRTVKVKIERATLTDRVARLRSLRSTIPRLRVDLNGCFPLDEVAEPLARIAELDPELVEQPVPPADLHRLGPRGVRWFADETMFEPALARAVLEAPGCAGVVLKPAVIGLFASLRWAEAATERGLDVVVTHAFDGPIGLAAACALAMSLGRRPLACGLDRHPALGAFPDWPIAALAQEGAIIEPKDSGLGVGPR